MIPQVTLLDSLNFLPFALAAFSKAFGLAEQKGYFPHFFNKAVNWDYVGDMPDAADYGPAHMKPAARDTFYNW